MEEAPLWTPAGDDTHLDTFRKRINEKYDLHLGNVLKYAIRKPHNGMCL